mmetsp:Transcript_1110/g.2489  ORF Transcript_1110/g.2489 Transcript_1110/m.2489 type:complete len:212 (-) Transcript_1110:163-798(-)
MQSSSVAPPRTGTWTVVSECSRRASILNVWIRSCGMSPRADGTAWNSTVWGPLGMAPVVSLTVAHSASAGAERKRRAGAPGRRSSSNLVGSFGGAGGSGTTTVTGSEKSGPRDASVASLACTLAKCTPGARPEGSTRTTKLWLPRSLAESKTIVGGVSSHSAVEERAMSRSVPSSSSRSDAERPAPVACSKSGTTLTPMLRGPSSSCWSRR